MKKNNKIKIYCASCKNPLLVFPCRILHGDGRFCNRKCYAEWRKSLTGKNSPAWRGGTIKQLCLFCNKAFFVRPNIIKHKLGKFCSRQCFAKWTSKYRIGKKVYNWKEKINKQCQICNKIFQTSKYISKKGHGRFCSGSCAAVWNIKHMKKKNTSIEIILENILSQLGIKYESQKVIPFCRTVADFYIPEQRLVVYADGSYWHSRPKTKARDQNQDFLLGMNGYKVLRLKEDEINNKQNRCILKIKKLL